jgi:hypothetical protein
MEGRIGLMQVFFLWNHMDFSLTSDLEGVHSEPDMHSFGKGQLDGLEENV